MLIKLTYLQSLIQMGNICLDFKKLGIKERIQYGQNKIQQFTFIHKLNKSKISSVWVVKSTKQKTFHAIKVMNKVELARRNCINLSINQQSILSHLKHSLIANIIQSFQDASNLYILLEHMPYGSLRDYLRFAGNLTECQVRFVMICLFLTLEYLHKQKIAHLDIKPQNMVIDDKGYFRLCDFNLSHNFLQEKKKIKLSGIGTYGYQAPQIILNPQLIGPQADLYSAGVTCVEMLTGISKRNSQNFSGPYLKQIIKERVNISNECLNFIEKLLEDEPSKRLGANANFDQIWKHPWLSLYLTQRLQYNLKTIPSFINDVYKKVATDSLMEQKESQDGDTQFNKDQFLDRLVMEQKNFQKQFSGFKTIAYRNPN